MSGVPLEPCTVRRRRVPRAVPLHPGPLRLDVPLEAVDHADVRRVRHRRGHQRPLQGDPGRSGGTGLSTAFDLPTLMGRGLRRSAQRRRGRPGRGGHRHPGRLRGSLRRHRSLGDHHVDDDQLPGAASPWPCTCRRPRGEGSPRASLGGTLQNDILKEYQAQKEFVFPPRPSVRLVADVIRFCAAEMPRWHPVSVSGYHIREAGFDRGPGAGLHPGQRLRLHRSGSAGRPRRRRVRSHAQFLLQCPHRLLRRDRQVPGGPADLGPVDAGPLRRHRAHAPGSCASTPRPPACP